MKQNVLKIGRNNLTKVGGTLADYGIGGKVLYISDSIVDELYGTTIKEQIEHIGRLKEELINCNTIAYAMDVAERIIATDVQCIVAVGGGRVLDVGKYAAYVSKCPILSIPTTMANDGIASPIAVLKRQDGKPKSLGCAMPNMLLIDTKLVSESPIEFIKAGIGDTISNYMALQDWDLAVQRGKDVMNGYAYMMSKNSLDVLMKTKYNTADNDFIDVLANSLVLSGLAMNFAGSSRPVSGSEHLFSHALDFYGKVENLHGMQVALGTVAVLKLIGHRYDLVLNYLNKLQVCINPISLNIDRDTFVYCMQHAIDMRNNRYTYLHETNLDTCKLEELYGELREELSR